MVFANQFGYVRIVKRKSYSESVDSLSSLSETDPVRSITEQFGDNVRKRRTDLGLSQAELAELAGLDRTYIGSVERGERNLSLTNIVRLAEALNCTPVDLMQGIKSP